MRVVAGAFDDPELRVGDPGRELGLVLGGNRKSSRPAITSVGTVIWPRRSMTVQPLVSRLKPKICACGRSLERRSANISRTADKRLVWGS